MRGECNHKNAQHRCFGKGRRAVFQGVHGHAKLHPRKGSVAHGYIYFRATGKEQMFDLDSDPGELHDVAGDARYRDVLAAWRQRMVVHLAIRGKKWVRKGKLKKSRRSELYSPNYPRKA